MAIWYSAAGACTVNFYANVDGTCIACPGNSSSINNSTSSNACVCNKGFSGPVDGVCSPCKAGNYRGTDLQDILRLDPPYIVSDAADWNSKTQRFDSLCGINTCLGNTGFHDATSSTVLALLPKKTPHPVFASETTRNNTAAGSTVLPVYNLSGGPTGNGDVHFNRTYGQFIEAGVRPFNMSTNGGFSIVTVLRINGVLFESEPILEFTNSPSQSDRIYLGTTEYSNLILSITQGNKHCEFKIENSIMSGTWLTIIAKIFKSKNRIDLTIWTISCQITKSTSIFNKRIL